jgi:hypothetical protein
MVTLILAAAALVVLCGVGAVAFGLVLASLSEDGES